MCIRDRLQALQGATLAVDRRGELADRIDPDAREVRMRRDAVSYTHLRAHETVLDIVCRLLLEKKKTDVVHRA